jgi:hypothetical protein
VLNGIDLGNFTLSSKDGVGCIPLKPSCGVAWGSLDEMESSVNKIDLKLHAI